MVKFPGILLAALAVTPLFSDALVAVPQPARIMTGDAANATQLISSYIPLGVQAKAKLAYHPGTRNSV